MNVINYVVANVFIGEPEGCEFISTIIKGGFRHGRAGRSCSLK